MDTPIQIFIVFHNKLYDECYANIPKELLDKYFTFFAVNEMIEKKIDETKYKVLKEWELPIYDSTFQEKGYNENSALYHIYKNNLHKKYKYIGFFQYDMIFTPDFVKILHYLEIQCLFPEKKSSIYFPFKMYSWRFVTCWKESQALQVLLDNYKKHYKKELNKIPRNNYPLLNSYILPCAIYENAMNWVSNTYDKVYPLIISRKTEENKNHIGGIYERIMSIAIGEMNGLSSIELEPKYVNHDHFYKEDCNNDITIIEDLILEDQCLDSTPDDYGLVGSSDMSGDIEPSETKDTTPEVIDSTNIRSVGIASNDILGYYNTRNNRKSIRTKMTFNLL